MNDDFSVKQAFRDSWRGFKAYWLFLIGVYVVLFIILQLVGLPIFFFDPNQSPFVVSLFNLISMIVYMGLMLGLYSIMLTVIRGGQPSFSQLFVLVSRLPRYVMGYLLYVLMVLIGLILLVVPGVYLAVRYQFYVWRLADSNDGPLAALQYSAALTKGHVWQLVGFMLALVGFNLLGLVSLGLGYIVIIPMTSLAIASAYVQLSHHLSLAAVPPSRIAATPEQL